MIKEITVQNFKRFEQPTTFQMRPEGITYLSGEGERGAVSLLASRCETRN